MKEEDVVARIAANPKYHRLVRTRSSYSITMTILVMLIYYGYILLIAFDKDFLAQNSDRLQAARVEGVEPEFEAISTGEYPISRSLFIYVKRQHVGLVPGIEEYLAEFTSEDAWGEYGYLADRGLIPLHEGERRDMAERAANLRVMDGAPE